MTKATIFWAAVVVLVLGVAPLALEFPFDETPLAEEPYALDDPGTDAVSFALGEVRDQQESVLVTIDPISDSRVRIGVEVEDPSGRRQPVHLYRGMCEAEHGREVHDLRPIDEDGRSIEQVSSGSTAFVKRCGRWTSTSRPRRDPARFSAASSPGPRDKHT